MKTLSDSTLRGLNRNALVKTIKELYAMRDEAIQILFDKGTFNLNDKYGIVFLDLLDILQVNKEE